MYMYVCIYIYIYIHIYICICIYLCMYVCVCVCVCVCVIAFDGGFGFVCLRCMCISSCVHSALACVLAPRTCVYIACVIVGHVSTSHMACVRAQGGG